MDRKTKRHVTIILPVGLHERLNEMRWERRAPSFTGLLRDLLEDCVDRHEHEKEHESQHKMAQSSA